MPQLIDLTDQQFGRLTVAGRSANRGVVAHWLCRCECGTDLEVAGTRLRSGETKSCGCLRREITGAKNRRHGMSDGVEFGIWLHMKDRCSNPSDPAFKNYGARGISVCDAWESDFLQFFKDMGPRPEGLTVERIDVNGNYEPRNCRWASRPEQSRNTRRNVIVEWEGETMVISDLARKLGFPKRRPMFTTLYRSGVPLAEAVRRYLENPIRHRRRDYRRKA